jgi:hypothetical protein
VKTFNKKDVFCIANADEAKQYIGHECYFDDSYRGLQYSIDNDIKCILRHVGDPDISNTSCVFTTTNEVKVMDGRCLTLFGLCLPCELVKKEEPKYRAFNGIEEFEKTLNIKLGDLVEFMDVTIRRTALYTGNAIGISGTQYITLGGYVYQFIGLFKDCKLVLDGKLVPFGILDKE